MSVRPRTPEDHAAVTALLQQAQLPPDGLEATVGFVLERGGRIVGHVALEPFEGGPGEEGFVLRSLATAPELRGQGLGRELFDAAESRAGEGLVVLRTETIGPWVLRRGYLPATLADLPPGVRGTSQFRGALCASTPVYQRRLRKPA